jgi:hypothetical protein
MLNLIEEYDIVELPESDAAEKLAAIYIREEVIPSGHRYDALHIAIASVYGLDAVVSYNCHHIAKLKTVLLTNVVNKRFGYPYIQVCTPMEVVEND